MSDRQETTDAPGLFGDTLPPALPPWLLRLRREADVLLLAVPEPPGGLWLDRDSERPARELVRQGRARMIWLREPGVYELRRVPA